MLSRRISAFGYRPTYAFSVCFFSRSHRYLVLVLFAPADAPRKEKQDRPGVPGEDELEEATAVDLFFVPPAYRTSGSSVRHT